MTASATTASPGGLRIAWSRGERAIARLDFSLAQPGRARLELFGVDGRRIRCLQDGLLAAGSQSLRWDGTTSTGAAAAAGVYYARLSLDGGTTLVRPLMLIR